MYVFSWLWKIVLRCFDSKHLLRVFCTFARFSAINDICYFQRFCEKQNRATWNEMHKNLISTNLYQGTINKTLSTCSWAKSPEHICPGGTEKFTRINFIPEYFMTHYYLSVVKDRGRCFQLKLPFFKCI